MLNAFFRCSLWFASGTGSFYVHKFPATALILHQPMAGSAAQTGRPNTLGVRKQGTKSPSGKRSNDDIRLSKAMSKVLRHKPPACMDSSGWVPLNDLVSHIGIAKSTDQILRVVQSDEKGRFEVWVACYCLSVDPWFMGERPSYNVVMLYMLQCGLTSLL